MEQFHGTTIVCVRRGNTVTMGGDGQVTLGNVVFKATARKVRRIYHDRILVALPAQRPMLLHWWNASKANLKNIRAT